MPTPDDATKAPFERAQAGVAGIPDAVPPPPERGPAGGGPIDPAINALNWIITRSTLFVAEPEPYHFKPEHLRVLREPGSQIRLAIASVPIPPGKLEETKTSKVDSQYFRLFGLKSRFRRQLRGKLKRYVELACEHDCRFFFVNELGFPLDAAATNERKRDRDLRAFVSDVSGFLTRDAHPRYLVAGSFHDPASKYNLAPIVVRPAADEPTISHYHSKKTSATHLFEKVRLPPDRKLRLYRTAYGRMAVLICLDFYDASQLLSLIQHNDNYDRAPAPSEERIDLLAVVSFGMPREDLCEDAVREVSELLGAAVAFAHSRSDQSLQFFYVGGKKIDPVLMLPSHDTPELSIFDLKADDLQQAWERSRVLRRSVSQLLARRTPPSISKIKIL